MQRFGAVASSPFAGGLEVTREQSCGGTRSRVVEGAIALVENVVLADDLQPAPATSVAPCHWMGDLGTAPLTRLLISLAPAEEPTRFDVPAVKVGIGYIDKRQGAFEASQELKGTGDLSRYARALSQARREMARPARLCRRSSSSGFREASAPWR